MCIVAEFVKQCCVFAFQGKQKQAKRSNTFFQFCNAAEGILLCTDVAARGLDIPQVDWIVQYDPPDEPKVSEVSMHNYVTSSSSAFPAISLWGSPILVRFLHM